MSTTQDLVNPLQAKLAAQGVSSFSLYREIPQLNDTGALDEVHPSQRGAELITEVTVSSKGSVSIHFRCWHLEVWKGGDGESVRGTTYHTLPTIADVSRFFQDGSTDGTSRLVGATRSYVSSIIKALLETEIEVDLPEDSEYTICIASNPYVEVGGLNKIYV